MSSYDPSIRYSYDPNRIKKLIQDSYEFINSHRQLIFSDWVHCDKTNNLTYLFRLFSHKYPWDTNFGQMTIYKSIITYGSHNPYPEYKDIVIFKKTYSFDEAKKMR